MNIFRLISKCFGRYYWRNKIDCLYDKMSNEISEKEKALKRASQFEQLYEDIVKANNKLKADVEYRDKLVMEYRARHAEATKNLEAVGKTNEVLTRENHQVSERLKECKDKIDDLETKVINLGQENKELAENCHRTNCRLGAMTTNYNRKCKALEKAKELIKTMTSENKHPDNYEGD